MNATYLQHHDTSNFLCNHGMCDGNKADMLFAYLSLAIFLVMVRKRLFETISPARGGWTQLTFG